MSLLAEWGREGRQCPCGGVYARLGDFFLPTPRGCGGVSLHVCAGPRGGTAQQGRALASARPCLGPDAGAISTQAPTPAWGGSAWGVQPPDGANASTSSSTPHADQGALGRGLRGRAGCVSGRAGGRGLGQVPGRGAGSGDRAADVRRLLK